jgi:DNA-binding MarR family transcriptional regulator
MAHESTVLDRLLLVSELLQNDMERAFEGTPLTPARTRVLWEIATNGPSQQQALAHRMEVSPRNITGLVDALEAAGYVARTPDASDRRAVIVSLTASAEKFMRRMQRDHQELSQDLLSAVDPADRGALLRGIDAVTARLQQLIAVAHP